MKRIFLTAGIILMAVTVTLAYNNTVRNDRKGLGIEKRETRKELRRERRAEHNDKVSYFTKNQFRIDFPVATNVQFLRKNNFDEVAFMSGNENLVAYYDDWSKLVGTIQQAEFTDLPLKAQKKIQEKYAAYTISQVVKFDDNESNDMDMILYQTPISDEDNYFVELRNAGKAIVVKVGLSGGVSFFTTIK